MRLSVELGNILRVRIYLPINMDDVVNECLEASDKYMSREENTKYANLDEA